MNQDTERYLRSFFRDEDKLQVLLLAGGRPLSWRIAPLKSILAAPYQTWLREMNQSGYNIYHSAAVLKPNATGRTKSDILELRRLFIDLDTGRQEDLAKVLASDKIPKPNWIVTTSPGKYQLSWSTEPIRDQDVAEKHLRGLALEFGADPQATDITRMLRLPGTINNKYPERPTVEATPHPLAVESNLISDFNVRMDVDRKEWRQELYRQSPQQGQALDYLRQFGPILTHLRNGMEQERAERLLANRYSAIGVASPERKAHQDIERAVRRVHGYEHSR